jgi:hypothetical protein
MDAKQEQFGSKFSVFEGPGGKTVMARKLRQPMNAPTRQAPENTEICGL